MSDTHDAWRDFDATEVTEPDRDNLVREWLDRYTHAFVGGDVDTIATMWDAPAYVLSDEGAHAVASASEVAQFFAGARDQYEARGVTHTRPDVENITWLTDRLVSVDVRFPWLDDRGEEHGSERSRYVLRAGEDRVLRLQVAVLRGAQG